MTRIVSAFKYDKPAGKPGLKCRMTLWESHHEG